MSKQDNNQSLEKRLTEFLSKNFDFPERVKAFRDRKTHTLEIELTNYCNLSCFYCYTNQSNPSCLSLDKAKEIIDQAKSYGIKRIVWLGGEPTLNPNWREIVEYSRRQGLLNELWSNGTNLKDNAETIAENCDRFVLHLDSINTDVFLSVQDKKLSSSIHSEILQGLDHLLEAGYSPERIRLNVVLSRKTLPYLEKTMRYFYPARVGSITLIPLFATGKVCQTDLNIFLPPQELQEAFKLRALVENRPERLLTGTAEYDKWYQMTTVYITAKGDITPYAGVSISAGNIYTENLRDILEPFFDFLSFSQAVNKKGTRNYINGNCGSCNNSRYCFGTRANSFFHSGNFVESDNTCWK